MTSPYTIGQAITPSDTVNLPLLGNRSVCDAIYVGVGGAKDMVVVLENDVALTLKNVISGTVYPIRAKRVNNSSTTATDLVALYSY